jgi:hypothetical protein
MTYPSRRGASADELRIAKDGLEGAPDRPGLLLHALKFGQIEINEKGREVVLSFRFDPPAFDSMRAWHTLNAARPAEVRRAVSLDLAGASDGEVSAEAIREELRDFTITMPEPFPLGVSGNSSVN